LTAAFVVRNGAQGKTDRHKIDGRGVERVDRLFQIDAKRLVDIELASHGDQALREVA
jgi:hypothetical protein